MRRIQLVFIAIFLAIGIPTLFLLHRSYLHLQAESDFAFKEHAYLILQMLNQRIYDDLAIEEHRSYSEYRFIRAVPVIGGEEVTLSELAQFPIHSHYGGMIGHFQMEPDGSIKTPVLPDGLLEKIPVENKVGREAIRDSIFDVLNRLEITHVGSARPSPRPEESRRINRDSLSQLYGKDFKLAVILNEDRQFRRRYETSSKKEALVFDVESARLQGLDSTIGTKELAPTEIMEVEIDPFQARFDADHILYYRNVWRNNERFIQGFAVRLQDYLGNLVLKEIRFSPEEQPIALSFGNKDMSYVHFGKILDNSSHELFSIPLQYPLNEMYLKVSISRRQAPAGSGMILLLGFAMLAILGGGLFSVYRLTVSQIKLASKRQDFISAVSHELKTPLTAIRMYAELLQNQWVSSEAKRVKYYDMIASETDRLTRLIQNVLSLSNLERNRWHVQMQQINPRTVLEELLATYRATIEKAGFTLDLQLDTCEFTVLMDKDAITQILMNLVDNSIKFAKGYEPRLLSVGLHVQGNDVFYSVRDHGPGIPTSEMGRVFEEFYRVENEMTRTTSGTGIGLSMVKRLCALTHLRIYLQNANPGLRTEVHFPPLGL